MDNHPIPQDITGFQFKLIGAMTIRQFAYLATGAIIAFVFFFLLPISIFIKLPVSIISLSIGASFAFVSVGGRPMDTMVSNFFKALFAPTQYIYTKTGGDLSQASTPPITVQNSKNSTPPPLLSLDEEDENKNAGDSPEASNLQALLAQTQLQKEALEKELEMLRASMNQTQQTSPPVSIPPPQGLPVQMPPPIQIQQQAPVQTQPQPQIEIQAPPPPPPMPPQPPKQAVKSNEIPMPEAPNLITGILKDPRGNPLQNILVEVKDENQNPVRAFKTNGLGQFASATSLSDGKYIISFEDPKEQNRFDPVQIEAVGTPIVPLEITSIDSREELRRQLFN